MASQTNKSTLYAKYGDRLKKAHDAHKSDETTLTGFVEMPAGIDNGIARLAECYIGYYKDGDMKGEPYLYAAGVAVEPEMHDGQKVAGKRTQIMEPMCDTPNRSRKTFEDHHKWVYNFFRLLSIDTNAIEGEDIEHTCASLAESGVHFRFRTWKGDPSPKYPNPRVNHSWGEWCDYTSTSEAVDHVEDDSEAAPPPKPRARISANTSVAPPPKNLRQTYADAEKAEEAPPPRRATPKTLPAASKVTPPAQASKGKATPPPIPKPANTPTPGSNGDGEEGEVFNEFEDIASLIDTAAAGDEEAGERLRDLAREVMIDEDTIKTSSSWQELGDLIESRKQQSASNPDDESNGEVQPGICYFYHPIDPKTKQKGRRKIEVQVETVNASKKTAVVRDLNDGKTLYSGVKWEDLIIST